MNMIAVFPGQGAQKVAMGKSFYDESQEARKVFHEVDDALSMKLSDIIFNGPAEKLQLTQYAQPALMCVSIAAVKAFEEIQQTSLENVVHAVAGHSLGEYSALCASNALSITDCARILQKRGQAMQEAVPEGKGAMAAFIGGDEEQVSSIIHEAKKQNSNHGVLSAANDNAPGQIVVSGDYDLVCIAIDIAKKSGLKRAMLLPVSAPFHCSLMQKAEEIMRPYLEEIPIQKPALPIYANVSTNPTNDPEVIRENLIRQICAPVRWRETMIRVEKEGYHTLLEFGAGNVLAGLAKRCMKEGSTHSFSDIGHIHKYLT